MTDHYFETHEPVELYVENGKGLVEVHATETSETHVALSGPDADDVDVRLEGRRLSVVPPSRRGLRGDHQLDITVTLPTGSDLVAKLGSSDLRSTGSLGTVQVRTGSGDVALDELAGPTLVESGSGDVTIGVVHQALRVKSGSGDVQVGATHADLAASTGSGDVQVRDAAGVVAVKTGSGDLTVVAAHGDVALTTGSGDLDLRSIAAGRVQVKGASGDVRVGVPAGVPVWTDLLTVSGRIHSTLEGAGEPEPGADHVELRAKTVSGDIELTQI